MPVAGPDPRFLFHALATGQSAKTKFLVVSGQELDLENIPGTRVLLSRESRGTLIALLKTSSGQAIATAWGVSEKLVSRLKAGLGLGLGHGGDRRSEARPGGQGAALPVQVVGAGQQQLLIIGPAARLEFESPPESSNILIEKNEAARAQFRFWLENITLSEAAARLGVGRNVILWCRKFLGIQAYTHAPGRKQRRGRRSRDEDDWNL